jgi:MFS family permease
MTFRSLPSNRNFVLLLLILIYISNNMDRYAIAFLAEPIRHELQFSDTQIGLLTGLIFALFYTLFGVPVGWLADRFGRIRVIVVTCTLWSVCSALGGLAGNFAQLALARIGVGVGDAGGAAPSYSLISAFYGPHERGTAFGLFHLGAPLASLVGAFACAWVAAHYGWRMAIIAVSFPGVLVAVVLFIFVREPLAEPRETDVQASSLGAALTEFFGSRIYWMTALTAGLSSFTTYALAAWLPSFLMRVKGMTLQEFGVWYAAGYALAFGIGIWLGGYLADKIAKRNERAYALVPCFGLLIAAPFMACAILAPNWQLSLLLAMVPVAAIATFLAPGVTLIQNISPPSRRAVFGALFLFVNNLIGSGLGPLYVGMISDHLRPSQGDTALAFGLGACVPVLLIASAAQYLVSRLLGSRRLPAQRLATA